jgi:uncharacterized glyoxalase superfamily protein PhnB
MSPKTAARNARTSKASAKKPAKKPAAKKKTKKVSAIPKGYPQVIPYLTVKDADAVASFATKTFEGKLKECMRSPDGKIVHGEVWIGKSVVMMGTASEKWPERPAMIYVYVKDCDAAYRRALGAGATSMMEPADHFYGDRSATVVDSQGIVWSIGTHVEDVSPKEMARRAAEHVPA